MRAWTVGFGPSYAENTRIAGNSKAPSGVAFPNKVEADAYCVTDEGKGYAPFEIELLGDYSVSVTRDGNKAAWAFHRWHKTALKYPKDKRCKVCMKLPIRSDLPQDALLLEARFINPSTGEPA